MEQPLNEYHPSGRESRVDETEERPDIITARFSSKPRNGHGRGMINEGLAVWVRGGGHRALCAPEGSRGAEELELSPFVTNVVDPAKFDEDTLEEIYAVRDNSTNSLVASLWGMSEHGAKREANACGAIVVDVRDDHPKSWAVVGESGTYAGEYIRGHLYATTTISPGESFGVRDYEDLVERIEEER